MLRTKMEIPLRLKAILKLMQTGVIHTKSTCQAMQTQVI